MSWGTTFKGADDMDIFTPIAEGEYLVRVKGIELRKTRAGDGAYYNVEFQVLEPASTGRIFFDMFTYQHTNEKAVEIGRGKMKQMLRAGGFADFEKHPECRETHKSVEELDGPEEFVQRHKPFLVRVVIEKSEKWGDKNKAQRFLFANRDPAGPDPTEPDPVPYATRPEDVPSNTNVPF